MAFLAIGLVNALAQPDFVTVRDPWRSLNGRTNQVLKTGAVRFEGRVLRAQDDKVWIVGRAGDKDLEFIVVDFPIK